MSDDLEDAWVNEEEEVAPRPVRRRRSPRSDQRGNLYLLTGLVLGLVLGLVYAWLISPVQYVDNAPSSLAGPYKDEYRRLIALAYSADKNLGRARERLALLDTAGSIQTLASQAQRMLAENQPPQEARALAVLAADLGKPQGAASAESGATPSPQGISSGSATEPAPVKTSSIETTLEPTAATEISAEVSAAIQTPTQPLPTHTPTITNTPQPTFTPRPTSTPLPVLDAPFVLKSKNEVCEANVEPGVIQIQVMDANEKPLPGVRIVITWNSGEEVFFTGLIPEINPGYADFKMDPDISYTLRVGDASEEVRGIKASSKCQWQMNFQQTNKN